MVLQSSNMKNSGLIDMSRVKAMVPTPSKEMRPPRLYSAKSSNSSTFGLYPNKGNDDLIKDLIDLRKEITDKGEDLQTQKLKMLTLIAKTVKKFDPSFKDQNTDLDLTQLHSNRSNI